jgi:SHS2 domain-containing protein
MGKWIVKKRVGNMPYEFLEDVATADIAFTAQGDTLEETFRASAEATLNVMVENIEAIQPKDCRAFRIENTQLDLLLFDFIQEIIYYKDAEKMMLRVGAVKIQREGEKFILHATAQGETLDPERHLPRVDVKAVTLHQFRLERTGRGWEAQVILDI